MKFCPSCGSELSDQAKFCPNCGHQLSANTTSSNNSGDENNAGFNFLSFLFPLIGLVFYLVWEKNYPIRAKGCGKWAIIGVVVNAVISIIESIISAILMHGFLESYI